jgi:HSP20 family protein
MSSSESSNWMLSGAIESLARAERMHRQLFTLVESGRPSSPCWEPPADVIETEQQVLVLVALPGVDPEEVQATIEGGSLVVSGKRVLPPELRHAVIHRLELPQGRFERRISLPPGRYVVRRFAENGCMVFTLDKAV